MYSLYAYVRDNLGQITDLVKLRAQTSNGTTPVNIHAAHYEYDAFGKLLAISNLADNIGDINPIRYKEYYYDSDLQWYHLKARFYDPEIGRFINADKGFDGGAGLLGYNLFAYCANNPVNAHDPNGEDVYYF